MRTCKLHIGPLCFELINAGFTRTIDAYRMRIENARRVHTSANYNAHRKRFSLCVLSNTHWMWRSHVKRFRCVLDECASANTHRILRVNEAYV